MTQKYQSRILPLRSTVINANAQQSPQIQDYEKKVVQIANDKLNQLQKEVDQLERPK